MFYHSLTFVQLLSNYTVLFLCICGIKIHNHAREEKDNSTGIRSTRGLFTFVGAFTVLHCEFLKFGILSRLFQYLSVTFSFRKNNNDTDGDKDRCIDTKYLHYCYDLTK